MCEQHENHEHSSVCEDERKQKTGQIHCRESFYVCVCLFLVFQLSNHYILGKGKKTVSLRFSRLCNTDSHAPHKKEQ